MRVKGMIHRIFTEMLRDKRTLALMFLGPLLILTLVYFLFQGNGTQTATLLVKNVDQPLITALKNDHLEIKATRASSTAKTQIRRRDAAGMLVQNGDKLTLTLANSDQSQSTIIKQSLQQAQVKLKMQTAAATIKTQAAALKQLQIALAKATGQAGIKGASQPATTEKAVTIKTHYLYGGADATYFETLLPILLGFIVFFFVFLISGIALLRERTTGTLYRLLATPVRRGEIIAGYLAGYGLFAVVQTLLIVLYTIGVFKVQIIGSLWLVLLINLLMAAVALTMGLFISTFADSEFQMIQFIPIVALPQIFFSGIIPVATMPGWLQVVAHIFPLYYGAQSMTAVIEKGATLTTVGPSLLILFGFALVFLVLNGQTMKRYRQV
ncbi:ABC transporter permease [Lacticaseibacillus mingshuiensis]|uniref:ABC transporter permease n=1 Tax=Lacticaseibacillus mingshuiensis TaxID=2799574 RepID=UPI0019528D73|nr:ABC transporter permease [Lacticaseibacillus mingshuiensis]